MPGEIAVYVHVPFCRARCAYRDFNTYAGLEELIPVARQGKALSLLHLEDRSLTHKDIQLSKII